MNINEICDRIVMKEGYLYEEKEEEFKVGDKVYYKPDYDNKNGKQFTISDIDHSKKMATITDNKSNYLTLLSHITKNKNFKNEEFKLGDIVYYKPEYEKSFNARGEQFKIIEINYNEKTCTMTNKQYSQTARFSQITKKKK